jgi:hypothetical protein
MSQDLYLYVSGIDFTSFYDFSIGIWKYSDSMVFCVFNFIDYIIIQSNNTKMHKSSRGRVSQNKSRKTKISETIIFQIPWSSKERFEDAKGVQSENVYQRINHASTLLIFGIYTCNWK